MKILCHTEHKCLIEWYSLRLVAPFPSQFDGCLDGFGPGVHREDHLKPEKLGDELSEFWEDIIIESSRAKG